MTELERGMVMRSRDLIITISNGLEELGTQFHDIEILNGKQTIARKRIVWEAVSSVKVSPKILFFKRTSGSSKHSILIHAVDDRPFRIVKIRCLALNVDILSMRDNPEIRKKLDIQLSGKELSNSKLKSTSLEIEIDHHVQKHLSIPILIQGLRIAETDEARKP